MKNDNWKADLKWVLVLSEMVFESPKRLRLLFEGHVTEFIPGYEIATPAKLRNFVKKHKILIKNRETEEKQDFAIALLKSLVSGTEGWS